ncbi:MAG: radical SAM/SPASM domain-containing protein [Polyangia bacterium]
MRASITPRASLTERTPLQDVIPLSTPFVLLVDPVNICNFRCTFCPTGDSALIRSSGRWRGRLDYDLYTKIIDDLAEFDRPLRVLRLYKEGEPLLHPRLADMVRYAKSSGHVQHVEMTTNGFLLRPARTAPILDAGIDRINISINGMSNDQYSRSTQTRIDFKRFVDNIRRLYERKGSCEICIKIPGDVIGPADRQRFLAVFGEIADRVFIENLAPAWPAFDVEARTGFRMTKGVFDNAIQDVRVCPYIFYTMVVNSDGSVSLCCADWAHKLKIGDVRHQSLKEVWEGGALRRHQTAQLAHDRKSNPVCATCGLPSHCLLDNIDAYAAALLERIESKVGGCLVSEE